MTSSTSRTFDPFNQNVTILVPPYGPVDIGIQDVTVYAQYGIRICVNYSSQIGASFVLLIALLLVTRPEKRSSAIFILNSLALFVNTIRTTLAVLYFTGPFYDAYAYFGQDYSKVPRSYYGTQIAADVMSLLVLICVESSLLIQIKAVTVTLKDTYKLVLLFVTGTLALVAITFRLALTIENSKAIINLDTFYDFEWLSATNNYLIMASICLFSAIFVAKLGITILERRKMGLKQFGPMQIIFIMGCQTLIIPAAFSILQNVSTVPELGSQALTITVVFLPLSAIWASSVQKSRAGPNMPSRTSLRARLLAGVISSRYSDRADSSEKKSRTTSANSKSATSKVTMDSRTSGLSSPRSGRDVESGLVVYPLSPLS